MIFKQSINWFLDRPLRDLSIAKRWSIEKVDRKIAELDPQPTFLTPSYLCQKVGFLLGIKYPMVNLYDMGLGKSKMVLDIIRYLIQLGRIHRALILVPNVVNIESWRQEIKIHSDLSASYVFGNRSSRIEAIEDDTDLCISTYAGLNALACMKVKGHKGLVINQEGIKSFKQVFDAAILDECQAIMNSKSLTFRVVSQTTQRFKWRSALTGTPIGRDPQALWSQFFCIDDGEALGRTLNVFRSAMFVGKRNYWGGFDFHFKKKFIPHLKRMMNHSSIQYASDECIDLPDKVYVEKTFSMSEEQISYYNALLARAQDKKEGMDIEGVFVHMRQIASGFVSIEGELSPLAENPRLELLLELINEIDPSKKVVIFNEFVWSGKQITEALNKLGYDCARLYSGTKDKGGELRRFREDKNCRFFAVNNQSGAQGLNLQVAHYAFMYETTVRPLLRAQAEKRCHRPGQTEKVFIFDLIALRTCDQRIQMFLKEGKDLSAALLRGGLGLLGKKIMVRPKIV